jgi:mono/diheme cytochrome c family protein
MRRLLRATLTASLSLSACSFSDRDLPSLYRELAVPRGRLASPDWQRQGRTIYRQHCVLCHGEQADGRGVQAHDLTPPPRDLTNVEWQVRTDEQHVYYAIAEGRHGTPMPPWKATLSPGEIWSLVAYIRSLAPAPAVAADSGSAASAPPAAAGRGRP